MSSPSHPDGGSPRQPYTGSATPLPDLSPGEQRTWSTLAHAGGIVIGWLAGLLVYLMQKDRGPFVRAHAREALNFQITVTLAVVVVAIGWFTWVFVSLVGSAGNVADDGSIFALQGSVFVIYVPLILQLIFGILAAVAANKGREYRYPVSIRFLRG